MVSVSVCERIKVLNDVNNIKGVAFNFQVNCENYPRVITPAANKYLYVKISGVIMKQTDMFGNKTTVSQIHCGTSNRILAHTALYTAIICPYGTSSRRYNLVEIFSEGWSISNKHGPKSLAVDKVEIDYLGKELKRSIAVEFVGKEPGTYSVMWLELARRYEHHL